MWRNANHPEARRPETHRDAGFTLIEALIALAIAGLGLAMVIRSAGTGLASVGVSEGYVAATRRAQMHLDAVGVIDPLTQGERSGEDDDGFAWRTTVTVVAAQAPRPAQGQPQDQQQPQGQQPQGQQPQGQTQGQAPPPAQGLTLYRVEVSETMPRRLGRRTVVLTTLRLGQGGAARAP